MIKHYEALELKIVTFIFFNFYSKMEFERI